MTDLKHIELDNTTLNTKGVKAFGNGDPDKSAIIYTGLDVLEYRFLVNCYYVLLISNEKRKNELLQELIEDIFVKVSDVSLCE
jgi:hypothetical protein